MSEMSHSFFAIGSNTTKLINYLYKMIIDFSFKKLTFIVDLFCELRPKICLI